MDSRGRFSPTLHGGQQALLRTLLDCSSWRQFVIRFWHQTIPFTLVAAVDEKGILIGPNDQTVRETETPKATAQHNGQYHKQYHFHFVQAILLGPIIGILFQIQFLLLMVVVLELGRRSDFGCLVVTAVHGDMRRSRRELPSQVTNCIKVDSFMGRNLVTPTEIANAFVGPVLKILAHDGR